MRKFKNTSSHKIFYNHFGQISICSCMVTNKFKKFYDLLQKSSL